MTPAEITALRLDKPQEFDALVAQHVFGWRWVPAVTDGVYVLAAPFDSDLFRNEARNDVPNDARLAPFGGPAYCSDPAADLECHRKCKRDLAMPYFRHLGLILSNRLFERTDTGTRADWPLRWLEAYEVGDYAQAALTVMEEQHA